MQRPANARHANDPVPLLLSLHQPLQREPSLGADGGTRLPLFIDALAYGSELFTAPSGKEQVHGRTDDIDELALTANL